MSEETFDDDEDVDVDDFDEDEDDDEDEDGIDTLCLRRYLSPRSVIDDSLTLARLT